MVTGRGRLQGLRNILRFNYPMYVGTISGIAAATVMQAFLDGLLRMIVQAEIVLAMLQLVISLAASAYAYDWSGFYALRFLPTTVPPGSLILNLNAGFDECSEIIAARFPQARLQAYDFFDSSRHTEPSIRRARAAYPPVPGTLQIETGAIPEPSRSVPLICVLLAAHEIRNATERRAFLAELRRVLHPDGVLIITEHLRNGPNFIAYNVGALHFFSGRQWRSDFLAARLEITSRIRLNPFIHCYILRRDDHSA